MAQTPAPSCDIELAEDILETVDEIAVYVKKTPRQTFYLLEKRILPGFKLGGKWHARKSTIRRKIEELESGVAA